MSRVCEICGKGPSVGNVVVRKGSPKYKGGIGLHTTGITKRRFMPNLDPHDGRQGQHEAHVRLHALPQVRQGEEGLRKLLASDWLLADRL